GFTDITPQQLTTNPAVNFSTTSGSAVVTIVDAGISNVTTFDAIYLNTPIAVGGLILAGLYQITTIVGATSYKINAASAATSTVNNGGAVPVFDTTSGSATVTVTLAAHGRSVGDQVVFTASTTVGGVTIQGIYTVATVTSSSQFTVTTSAQA